MKTNNFGYRPSNNQPANPSLLSKRQQLLAASALIPVIGALSRPTQLQGLVFTFFVFVYLAPLIFSDKKMSIEDGKLKSATFKEDTKRNNWIFAASVIAGGLVSQALLWTSQIFAEHINPTLMHPQLRADLFLATFYYAALALAWLILLRRWRFTVLEVFLFAFLASLIEQSQLGLLPSLGQLLCSAPLQAVLTLASLLTAGGSIVAMAFIASGEEFLQDKKIALKKVKPNYTITLLLIVLLPLLADLGAVYAGRTIGIISEKSVEKS